MQYDERSTNQNLGPTLSYTENITYTLQPQPETPLNPKLYTLKPKP